MKLNQDKVPVDLEDAIKTLKEALDEKDILEIKKETFNPGDLHFSLGMHLRNQWSLWEVNSILVQWFKKTYKIEHADDISSIILQCLTADIKNQPRKEKELVKKYIQHWKKYK